MELSTSETSEEVDSTPDVFTTTSAALARLAEARAKLLSDAAELAIATGDASVVVEAARDIAAEERAARDKRIGALEIENKRLVREVHELNEQLRAARASLDAMYACPCSGG